MGQGELFSKEVLLATGARMRLAEVALTLGLLQGLLYDPREGAPLVAELRDVCLHGTEPPTPDMKAKMIKLGLLQDNGLPSVGMRQVVAAALRGEDNALYVVSPYTTYWDRVVSDLIYAKERVRASLPEAEAELLISTRDAGHVNTVEGLHKWVDQVPKRRGDLPPPSRN